MHLKLDAARLIATGEQVTYRARQVLRRGGGKGRHLLTVRRLRLVRERIPDDDFRQLGDGAGDNDESFGVDPRGITGGQRQGVTAVTQHIGTENPDIFGVHQEGVDNFIPA